MEKVYANEIRQCYEFACYAWENQSQSKKDFGNESRNRNDFIADQMSGKIAEIIFHKQVERMFPWIKVYLNFTHYLNPLQTDDGDVTICINNIQMPLKIDVKSSSNRAYWLPIEDYKYHNRETGEKVSDCYVMVKFDRFMPDSRNLRTNPEQLLNFNEVGGEICGWVAHEDLACPYDGTPWFYFNRGDRFVNTRLLPDSPQQLLDREHLITYVNQEMARIGIIDPYIGPTLKAQLNIGYPIKWLNPNIGALFNQIINQA